MYVQDRLRVFLVLCMTSSALGATTIFNVVSYGAVGNGRADDSQVRKQIKMIPSVVYVELRAYGIHIIKFTSCHISFLNAMTSLV